MKYSDLRAAARQKLLSLVKASVTASDCTFSASGSTVTRTSGDWESLFVRGDEVTISGSASNDSVVVVESVDTLVMTLSTVAANEAAGATVTVAAKLPVGVAWEGREFTPDTERPWIRESMNPLGQEAVAYGNPHTIRHDVIFMYDVFYPREYGTRVIEDMADSIIALFPVGAALAYGSVASAPIIKSQRQTLKDFGDAWRMCPLTIEAYTFGVQS